MTNHTGRVAAVVIPRTQSKKRYLIAKRKDNGDWEFAGGKEDLEQDQNILSTAKREIKEELNLEIKPLKSNKDFSYTEGGYEIIPVLAEHNYKDADPHVKLEDHDRYRWINPDNPPESIDIGKEVKCLEAFDLV